MKRAYHFEAKKFLSLPVKRQHKKCQEMLEAILKGDTTLLPHYNELAAFLLLEQVSSDKKRLYDRLQLHYDKSETFRKEHSFIVETNDKEAGVDYLPVYIYLDQIRSAHNIGSILRTTEALRLGTCIFSQNMANPDNVQVQKSAMNTSQWVTCKHIPLSECPKPLIILETVKDAVPYYSFTFPDTFTLALGNEEYGLSDSVLATATHAIHIPLYGRKNSLNVACAYAIVASEIARQKHKTP